MMFKVVACPVCETHPKIHPDYDYLLNRAIESFEATGVKPSFDTYYNDYVSKAVSPPLEGDDRDGGLCFIEKLMNLKRSSQSQFWIQNRNKSTEKLEFIKDININEMADAFIHFIPQKEAIDYAYRAYLNPKNEAIFDHKILAELIEFSEEHRVKFKIMMTEGAKSRHDRIILFLNKDDIESFKALVKTWRVDDFKDKLPLFIDPIQKGIGLATNKIKPVYVEPERRYGFGESRCYYLWAAMRVSKLSRPVTEAEKETILNWLIKLMSADSLSPLKPACIEMP